jgi:hypothetical protein
MSDNQELSGEKMYKLPGGEIVPVISLRDYFAAAALQGPLSEPEFAGAMGLYNYSDWAQKAYKFADAMLEARGE